MIHGSATPSATLQFAKNSKADQSSFRLFDDLTLSSLGVGTYLGDTDSKTDQLVYDAVKQSILSGVNVIDTAINYRAQKAERSIGRVLNDLCSDQVISRDQIFLCTKGGYVTNDADSSLGFWEYVKEEYTSKDIISAGDISSGYHCMQPSYLKDQLERSLLNLDVDCIDLLYLHNAVEGQPDKNRSDFLKQLSDIFSMYEEQRELSKIKYYGMATWECFRVPKDNPQYLSLEKIVDIAKDVGGSNHGFKFIQLPFNMYYDQALLKKNQEVNGQLDSILDASLKLNIGVFTSVPLMQGRLVTSETLPKFGTLDPALRLLQFIRSTPGVLAPLVGHKTPEHVTENLKLLDIPPMSVDEFNMLVSKLVS